MFIGYKYKIKSLAGKVFAGCSFGINIFPPKNWMKNTSGNQ